MRLDDGGDDVEPFPQPGMGSRQHLVGLTDARCGAEKDLEPAAAPVFALRLRQKSVGRRALVTVVSTVWHDRSSNLIASARGGPDVRTALIPGTVQRTDPSPPGSVSAPSSTRRTERTHRVASTLDASPLPCGHRIHTSRRVVRGSPLPCGEGLGVRVAMSFPHVVDAVTRAALLAPPDPHPVPLSTRERGGGRRRGYRDV